MRNVAPLPRNASTPLHISSAPEPPPQCQVCAFTCVMVRQNRDATKPPSSGIVLGSIVCGTLSPLPWHIWAAKQITDEQNVFYIGFGKNLSFPPVFFKFKNNKSNLRWKLAAFIQPASTVSSHKHLLSCRDSTQRQQQWAVDFYRFSSALLLREIDLFYLFFFFSKKNVTCQFQVILLPFFLVSRTLHAHMVSNSSSQRRILWGFSA